LARLPLESLLEQFATQAVAELDDEFLEGGEGRTPRRAIGPVEVMEQVFGRCLQDRTHMGRNFYRLCLYCHLELLSLVAQQRDGGLACPIIEPT
jgi:hypothetical protein